MWLVLCSVNDASTIWAYEGLKARGLSPIELVTAESLVSPSNHWEHRVGTDGVSLNITLSDGRKIEKEHVKGVLNQLVFVPAENLYLIKASDRSYVEQELSTFFMSWLLCLPQPMFNKPTPQGLSGRWRHITEWLHLASKAGLPTPGYQQSSRDLFSNVNFENRVVTHGVPVKTVIILNGKIVTVNVPPGIEAACQRLAELCETEILGIDFCVDDVGQWTFAGATTNPDLRLGGETLLNELAYAMTVNTPRGLS